MDKLAVLTRIFGTEDLEVLDDALRVRNVTYPIVDDVIITLPEERRPEHATVSLIVDDSLAFSRDIQRSFGDEWQTYDDILPEHAEEFRRYFDIVELAALNGAVVADLGCGMGRWSALLAPSGPHLVLVDFSEAIFVARRNLATVADAVFVMGDVTDLPFADDAFDYAFSLGVLHHLPVDALATVRSLRRLSPRLLVYLYYALDNRPAVFRSLLGAVSAIRRVTAAIRGRRARRALTAALTYLVYLPVIACGRLAERIGLGRFVPLHDTYAGKSVSRIRQDVYDRFFTSIEQRVSRQQILGLEDTFRAVRVSDGPPYWHFECVR